MLVGVIDLKPLGFCLLLSIAVRTSVVRIIVYKENLLEKYFQLLFPF